MIINFDLLLKFKKKTLYVGINLILLDQLTTPSIIKKKKKGFTDHKIWLTLIFSIQTYYDDKIFKHFLTLLLL